jgi:MtN3 and saliva related transmembrane protein
MSNLFNVTSVIGTLAGTLTTISFLPQLIKTLRMKSARDLSWGMWIVFVTGIALWVVYGFLLHALPVIIANVVTLVLSGWILVLKVIYRKN